jgi:hypothetical protein
MVQRVPGRPRTVMSYTVIKRNFFKKYIPRTTVLPHFEYLKFIMCNIFQQPLHGQETLQERPEIYLNLQLSNLKSFRRQQFPMEIKPKRGF